MSNSLAIAAVTTTLQSLINQGLRSTMDSVTVTASTLEKAQANREKNLINLLLYHAAPKLELGNQQQHHPRSKLSTPQTNGVALDLYYLMVAYGENGNEAKSHVLLGRLVQLLHDSATLSAAEIELATAREFPESDLHRQVETIQISPVALTFEEMSKVWQVMQSYYRPSLAYKVSVVMIDSLATMSSAMPVLSRHGIGGDSNGGSGGVPLVQLGLRPTITELVLPHRQPSARMGDHISIRGRHLEGRAVTVTLRHPLLNDPIAVSPLPSSSRNNSSRHNRNGQAMARHAKGVTITLPQATALGEASWLSGVWTLAVGVEHAADAHRVSNEFPLMIAPMLSALEPLESPAGNLSLSLTCVPAIRPEQRVMLLWGDRPIPVYQQSPSAAEPGASRLTFRIREMVPGVYPVRLRVDGVDSIPVDFATDPRQVDPKQQVRITAP